VGRRDRQGTQAAMSEAPKKKSDLTWPAVKMAKMIDVTPRRLQQLVFDGVIPKDAGRGRYQPFPVVVSYIRYLRDRNDGMEESGQGIESERKLLTIARREQINLEMEVTRKERIPMEDVEEIIDGVYSNLAGMLKANRGKELTDDLVKDMLQEARSIGAALSDA